MSEVTLHDILEDGYYINEISDGQFTGGVYSERWCYNYVDYELIWEGREVIDWGVYLSPEERNLNLEKSIKSYLKRKGLL